MPAARPLTIAEMQHLPPSPICRPALSLPHPAPPQTQDVVKRRYAYRPLVQLVGKSDAQRQQSARDAAKAVDNHLMQSPSHRQAAAAHFAGFWADESEDGAGDQQKVCAVMV